MAVHVSVRSISALLLLSVSLLGLSADALAQSVVAPQKTAPMLAEPLARVAAAFDRNRIDLHVPGAVLAYVGRYGDVGATDFAVLVQNQRLAVRLPNTSFDLLPPDATGRRATRANLGLGVTFEESQTGAVSAMNVHRPGAMPVLRLTPIASTGVAGRTIFQGSASR